MTRLRILFVSRNYPPEMDGGGGSYVAAIAPALVARGHEVYVLSSVPGQKASTFLDQGVHIHRVDQLRIPGLDRLRYAIAAPFTVTRIRTGLSVLAHYRRLGVDFDVIEIPDWGAEGWALALVHNKPIVAQLHTPLPVISRYHTVQNERDWAWASRLEYFAVHRADVITLPTLTHLNSFYEVGWLGGREVMAIPHAVDWYRWSHATPVQESPPTVLFLGRLEGTKSPELLVQAMRIIRRSVPNARALFVGRSIGEREGLPYLEWVKLEAHKVGGCEFVGQVPRNDVLRFLSMSRVLAVPSHFEGYCMAALEAMAAGRPVVVTEATGVAELVRKVDAGGVVPVRDPEALAAALLPFLSDVSYAAVVGERARVAVRTELDLDRIAGKREEAYRQAIAIFNGRSRDPRRPGLPETTETLHNPRRL